MKKIFSANGKLLLTAEYLVLEGALALALPVRLGQKMSVTENSSSDIRWTSLDHKNKPWFTASFSLYDFKATETSDEEISAGITKLLKACSRQDSEFLSQWKGQKVETTLEFDREWGLGSSSTLIYCMAAWADVNPYQLLMDTVGGSGYDIACAGADGPVLYSIRDYAVSVEESDFYPSFRKNLYFIYSGHKQSSQTAVKEFQRQKNYSTKDIDTASELTEAFNDCKTLSEFMKLMNEHESFISKILNIPVIKLQQFADFDGEIKSLGAWGGDFVLAATERDPKYIQEYFSSKGLTTTFAYDDLILKRK